MSIKIIKESFVVALNSKDAKRLNGTNLSNVNFDFRGLIRHNHNYKHLKVQILDAIIPHSFYNINPFNNLLVLDNIDYIIEAGNYTQKNLFETFSKVISSVRYGFQFDKITGKVTIIKKEDSNFTMQKESTMLSVLGYEQRDYVGEEYSIDGQFQKKIVGSYPLYLAGNHILKISSNALACHNHDSFNSNTNNTINFITVNAPPQSLIFYKNLSQKHFPLNEDYINDIDIQIYDENNNFINFNNTNWNIILSLSYEKEIYVDDVNFSDYKKQTQEDDDSLGKIKDKKKKEKEPIEEPEEDPIFNPVEDIPFPTMSENDLDLLLYNNHIYR